MKTIQGCMVSRDLGDEGWTPGRTGGFSMGCWAWEDGVKDYKGLVLLIASAREANDTETTCRGRGCISMSRRV